MSGETSRAHKHSQERATKAVQGKAKKPGSMQHLSREQAAHVLRQRMEEGITKPASDKYYASAESAPRRAPAVMPAVPSIANMGTPEATGTPSKFYVNSVTEIDAVAAMVLAGIDLASSVEVIVGERGLMLPTRTAVDILMTTGRLSEAQSRKIRVRLNTDLTTATPVVAEAAPVEAVSITQASAPAAAPVAPPEMFLSEAEAENPAIAEAAAQVAAEDAATAVEEDDDYTPEAEAIADVETTNLPPVATEEAPAAPVAAPAQPQRHGKHGKRR